MIGAFGSAGCGGSRAGDLWFLAVGPAIWGLHFMVSYVTMAVACARMPDAALTTQRIALAALTGAALLGIAAAGARAARRHLRGGDGLPHDDDTAGDRRRFLGFAALLLCALSFVATAWVALPLVFFGTCV